MIAHLPSAIKNTYKHEMENRMNMRFHSAIKPGPENEDVHRMLVTMRRHDMFKYVDIPENALEEVHAANARITKAREALRDAVQELTYAANDFVHTYLVKE